MFVRRRAPTCSNRGDWRQGRGSPFSGSQWRSRARLWCGFGGQLFRPALGTTNVPALLGALRFAAVDTSRISCTRCSSKHLVTFGGRWRPLSWPRSKRSVFRSSTISATSTTSANPGPRPPSQFDPQWLAKTPHTPASQSKLWTGVGIAPTPAAVAAAIRTCFRPSSSPRTRCGTRIQLADSDLTVLRMAVVVQKMVDADSAGVVFTADPRSGDRDVAVISAAWGLGGRGRWARRLR